MSNKKNRNIYTIGLGGDPALCICGQPLAQPHLLPCGVGDCIAKPAVGNLMNDVDDEEIITLQNGRDYEGQAWVLHSNNGEGRRKKNNIIPGTEGDRKREARGAKLL